MTSYLIKNAKIVNEGKIFEGDILLKDGIIASIASNINVDFKVEEINAEGKYMLPGVIDDQVHFREPGLTHKANIASESKAAVAGGVTSFMDMPNTNPPTFTVDLLEEKYATAAKTSVANYSFFMGTANDNYEEVMKVNAIKNKVCGVKIFMGSSTGNLLVDNPVLLGDIFANTELLIATHCEDEATIKHNLQQLQQAGVELTAAHHAIIRNEEACFESSFKAVQLAKKHNSRLHILHISTAKELQLFGNMLPLKDKKITSEVCVHHLHFTADDYNTLGYKIKCNPAIKAAYNKEELWKALLDDRLDVIATDHAPHLLSEKEPDYSHAHSGLPLVQHSLPLMLHYAKQGKISIEKVVEKMSHNVATCFNIDRRGFIQEGYFADLVMVDLNNQTTVNTNNILYKCGWSPLENMALPTVEKTFVNGHLVYCGNNGINDSYQGERLLFNR